MKSTILMAIAATGVVAFANTPPAITNVRASQREGTKLVDIHYDAEDADGDLLKVRVEISDNDGERYSVPAFSLTGDIGEGIAPGTDKHIVWDAGTDWDGEYSDMMRVKVFAIDAKGFPGMEWGNEVPPGGFLMGQDGGAEGSGPSRHVNIPWSYWLSKYEITNGQYCDFLNAAYAAGFVEKISVTGVCANASMPAEYACPDSSLLCCIGDSFPLRWNINKFEPTTENTRNLPANVTWHGAISFARFYGYDLPTAAEWEKAARGPANGRAGTHMKYPWGDTISSSYANVSPGVLVVPVGSYNGNQVPVGPDTKNGYGLYDIIGNAPEWTLSTGVDVESYPQEENLDDEANNPFSMEKIPLNVSSYSYTSITETTGRLVRGLGDDPIFVRKIGRTTSTVPCILTGYTVVSTSYSGALVPNYETSSEPIGFRVIRRQIE